MTTEHQPNLSLQQSHKQLALLDQVYEALDLVGRDLLDVTEETHAASDNQRWRERGDWIDLAARVDADRVFFVNDDPVLVFSVLPEGSQEDEIFDCYRRTWSLARPRCLFLAVGSELRVYSLASPPTQAPSKQAPTALEVITEAAEVGEKLADFHRERLESGATFEGGPLGEAGGRADQQLLKDVREATRALIEAGLPRDTAHTLIERAILIRYLEDRTIITAEYFSSIVSRYFDDGTLDLRRTAQPNFGQDSLFTELLFHKDATYELFGELAEDFNGDLFTVPENERDIVTEHHLSLLQSLLQGNVTSSQAPLFLWAYDFSVIPTNLISSMYEIFSHEDMSEQHTDTYYTPPELVEFVVADVLDDRTLDRQPTVCDPACGSGIFLVEAFRRMVRHEILQDGKPLSGDRLRQLLLGRIAGCDIDEAAIRLAAFSLYVAFLNYQSPQDIRLAGPLPPLIHREGEGSERRPLVVGDAFYPRQGKDPPESTPAAPVTGVGLPWGERGFDAIVGNPPWTEIRGERVLAEHWAEARGLPVGDRNPSQLFLWRALDLLAEDGVAALLVSAKAMLNLRSGSRSFRHEWLGSATLEHVVNFSQVRNDFFEGSVAPFMLLRFRRTRRNSDNSVIYETAREVPPGRRGSSALARLDRSVVRQASLRARDYLWKVYSAGTFHDDAFLARLEVEDRLDEWTSGQPRGYGFQRADRRSPGFEPPAYLRELRSLARFESWGPLQDDWFESVPSHVKRASDQRLFRGRRLLVREGVSARFGPHARIETEPFAFRHTVYGLSLDHLAPWQAKVILGTLVSSLGRYWLSMVTGSWGTWRDVVRASNLLSLPLRLTSASDPATRRIGEGVDQLQYDVPRRRPRPKELPPLPPAMEQIDEGVAELFELTDAERDLVSDFWAKQAQSGRSPIAEIGQAEGTESDIPQQSQDEIAPYLRVFVGAWNHTIGDEGELGWKLWRDHQSGVLAAVFETHESGPGGVSAAVPALDESAEWREALRRIGIQWEGSEAQSILRYGLVRAVSDTAIVVVKRDERHLWTRSAARQDVDATMAQVMSLR